MDSLRSFLFYVPEFPPVLPKLWVQADHSKMSLICIFVAPPFTRPQTPANSRHPSCPAPTPDASTWISASQMYSTGCHQAQLPVAWNSGAVGSGL